MANWLEALFGKKSPPKPAEPTRPAGPAFEPLNELERALVAAAQGTAAEQKAFERAFPDSKVFVATPDTVEQPGVRTFAAGEQVQLLNVQGPEGQAVAIFTHPARIAALFGEGTTYLEVPARDLIEWIHKDRAVLNPGQPHGVHWNSEALSAMIGKSTPRVLAKDTQVLRGSPKDVPHDLLRRLKASFEPERTIRAAWLALAHWPEEDKWGWYLDVRSDGDRESVVRLLEQALAGADLQGKPLDMVTNPPAAPGATGLVVVAER